ncbi:PadR family transcriptional regulator [Tepidiforma sp.]|jgi:PadR family transcriptional regulator AphA|uniref:PadR family transcriptional regulator n=1 Tax=Tepidiforma sp. TaxID=2682230 RepID=UPI0021DC244E|nr:PadR family transcriptional regulator [Tepidiforma sp.]MCX7616392.1 PadR family transcriptional regulator [Tepidiforma sp.]GIW19106.1 MAG: PadR family transcriptional regulator [Tepidiforma sp.]
MSLRFAILGLLTGGDLSGYEITRRFEQSVGYFWHARAQQIYPELARLESEGLVAGRAVQQTGKPDKRVYALTPRGLEELTAWVVTPSPLTLTKDEFLVKVWSYGLVEPAAALAALAAHRRQQEERLAAYRAIEAAFEGADPAAVPPGFLGPYLTLRAGIGFVEAFLAWAGEAERILRARAGLPAPPA